MKVIIHTCQHSENLNIVLCIKDLLYQIGAPFQTFLLKKAVPVRKMPERAVYFLQADDICYIAFAEQKRNKKQRLLILPVLMEYIFPAAIGYDPFIYLAGGSNDPYTFAIVVFKLHDSPASSVSMIIST